jgi:UDP-N-acetylmuramoyl-tripeptide--D-alanyl-D-alanine ligase
MGMNHRGEIALLSEIARPHVRLITNVGAAHVEGCGSLEGVALAKQELFDSAQPGDILCINLDDFRIAAMPVPEGVQVIRYGTGPSATIRLTDVSVDPVRLQTRLRIETPDGVVRATLQVPGAHLAINATAAVAVAYALRVPVSTLSAAIGRFAPEGMRNRVEQFGDLLVLDDAYNANPISMIAALRTLAALPGERYAVLGDMLELGEESEASHREVLEEAERLGIQHLLLCGERMGAVGKGELYPDVGALSAELVRSLRAHPAGTPRAVLIKGSRGARMERVLERLRAEWKCSTN